MIYGTGVDLVSIRRIEKVILRWGDRFVKKVFAAEEARICWKKPSPYSAFALRFAAKEAFAKSLGLGMRKGIRWRDIEIFNDAAGKPGLRLYGVASEICKQKGINGIHLSLSDDGEYGIAMVVLETLGKKG
ncbi:MAG: holo-ACP synthase [Pseudomonadota bacterium]|nr:holo-ACP synthase [Desulfobacterales bacterium]MBL7173376.1 holo-ACP synthase [Desulfobacteraceae bacterium]